MNALSILLLVFLIIPMMYWLLLAIAASRPIRPIVLTNHIPRHRFAIAIPAHDEDSVIADTVKRLLKLNYPADLFSIHVVADHCADHTAEFARQAGAIVHERHEEPRSGKGAALTWLFQRILEETSVDAVIIFDADTLVDKQFLQIMDVRLTQGDQVIQGQHVISNPSQGWFAALTWAMFLIDNRIQNQGRANLRWSAKHMGDSICFQSDVLRKMGWGEGLTEDFQLRQRLLLENICIGYESTAKGYGEAPQTWAKASVQRQRWLRGTVDSSQQLGPQLLKAAFKTLRGPLIDGAFQAYFPSYSTLSLISTIFLAVQIGIAFIEPEIISFEIIIAWALYVIILFFYPFWGLILEHAPLKAYLVILSGPFFIIWRSILAFKSRLSKKPVIWVRTDHGSRNL